MPTRYTTKTTVNPWQIIQAARTLINTPYKHQGRTATKELDCLGVVILTAKIAGILTPEFDYLNYPAVANGALERILPNFCGKLNELCEGAIATFDVEGEANHCGIISLYRGSWGLIHAYENAKRVREHELISFWADKIVNIYAFPNVNY